MEYVAIARNIKISPRKMRLVVDGVKKQKLASALSALTVMNKRASNPLKKAVESAIANATNNFGVKRDELSIKDIMVTGGLALKRYHFAARGRTRPYKRRQSHITVVLTDGKGKAAAAVAPTVVEAKKEEKVEKKSKKEATK